MVWMDIKICLLKGDNCRNMRLIAKRLGQSLVLGLILIIAGFLLMVGVYTLPTAKMKEHVREAVVVLEEEGTYPALYGDRSVRLGPGKLTDPKALFLNTRGLARDNYTDALMLGTAVFEEENVSVLQAAMRNARNSVGESVPSNGLKDYVNHEGKGDAQGYERYWHGYLLFLKPLLLIMNYSQIRMLNVVLQLLLIAAILSIMYMKNRDKQGTWLFVYSLLFICPMIIPYCMQYSTMFYIMLGAVLVVLKKHKYLMEKYRFWLFYFAVGMLTSYFDLLTYPLLSLGIPLILQLNMDSIDTVAKKWMQIIESSLLWGIGYAVMWSSKWVFASVILQEDIIEAAVDQVVYRSSAQAEIGGGGYTISAMKAIFSNFSSYTNFMFLILILIGLFAVIRLMRKNGRICNNWKVYAVYIPVIIMPVVWYGIFKNHSYTHGSFTYRALMITVYGGMSALVRGVENGTDF